MSQPLRQEILRAPLRRSASPVLTCVCAALLMGTASALSCDLSPPRRISQGVAAPRELALAVRMNSGLSSISSFHVSTPQEWKAQLGWAIGEQTLKARDERIARLAKVAQATAGAQELRCFILEHINVGPSGHPGPYESLILYACTDTASASSTRVEHSMQNLDAVRMDAPRSGILGRLVEALLSQGPSDNGIQSSALDVFVISYFDGASWKDASFSNFEELMDERPPAPAIPGACLFYVLDFVNTAMGQNVRFAPKRYDAYVSQISKKD